MKALLKFFPIALLVWFGTYEACAMRWYSPSTGRWFSRDPIGEKGGLNLYVFVGNNPVSRIDPWGKRGIEATSEMDLQTVVEDFVNGGPSNTYYFWPPHSLTERIKGHSSLGFLWQWYNNGAATYCSSHPAGKLSKQVSFQYTAPGSQFLDDYLNWWGQHGEGLPYGDFGLNVLGSFRVTARTEVDCCKRWRSLWVQIYNRFSEDSMLRKPWNRSESFDATLALSPVDLYITLEESGKF